MTSLIEPIMMVVPRRRRRRPDHRDVPADLRAGRQHQRRVTQQASGAVAAPTSPARWRRRPPLAAPDAGDRDADLRRRLTYLMLLPGGRSSAWCWAPPPCSTGWATPTWRAPSALAAVRHHRRAPTCSRSSTRSALRAGARPRRCCAHIQLAVDLVIAIAAGPHHRRRAERLHLLLPAHRSSAPRWSASRGATAWIAARPPRCCSCWSRCSAGPGVLPPLAGAALPLAATSAPSTSAARSASTWPRWSASSRPGVHPGRPAAGAPASAWRPSARAAADLLTLHSDIVRCLSSGLVTVDPTAWCSPPTRSPCDILGDHAGDGGRRAGRRSPARPARAAGRARAAGVAAARRARRRARRRPRRWCSASRCRRCATTTAAASVGRVVNFQDLTELRKMEQQRAAGRAAGDGRPAGRRRRPRDPQPAGVDLRLDRAAAPDAAGRRGRAAR